MNAPQPINNLNFEVEKVRDDVNANVVSYLPYEDYSEFEINKCSIEETGVFCNGKSSTLSQIFSALIGKDGSNYIENMGEETSAGSRSEGASGEEGLWDGVDNLDEERQNIEDELANSDDFMDDWDPNDPDGYQVPNERLLELAMRYQVILNTMLVIAMVLDAKHEARMGNFKRWFTPKDKPPPEEDKGKNISEIVGKSVNKGSKAINQLMKGILDEITKHNEAVKGEKIEEAKKEAARIADSFWNDVGDFFGAKSTEREKNYELAKRKEKIEKEFAELQKKIADVFEKATQYYIGTQLMDDDFDPFAGKIRDQFEKTNEENLINDAGNGYQDINKDNALAFQMWLTNLENLRAAYFKVKLAVQKAKRLALEAQTGIKYKTNVSSLLSKLMTEATIMEKQLFINMVNQIQQQIVAWNNYVTAGYEKKRAKAMYISGWVGRLMGGIPGILFSYLSTKLTDWITLEILDATIDDDFNPSDLNMDEVYRVLEKISGAVGKTNEETKDAIFEFLNEMDRRQQEYIEEMSQKGINRIEDGFFVVNWTEVNRISEKLLALQRSVEGVINVAISIAKARSQAIATVAGKGMTEDIDMVKGMVTSKLKDARLAFLLKADSILKKVDEHNKQRLQKLQLERARYAAGGMIVGIAVAVILIVLNVVSFGASTPLTVMAMIGFISACGGAGAALGEITYQSQHSVNDNLHKLETFYDDYTAEVTGDAIIDAFNRVEAQIRKHIDNINSSTYIDIGDDMRGLDIAAAIEARNEITQMRILQLTLLSIQKTLSNTKAANIGRGGGIPVVIDDGAMVKAGFDAHYEQAVSAFERKIMLVMDEIQSHNAKVEADRALTSAWISFGFNLASAVASGVSGGGGHFDTFANLEVGDKIAKVGVDVLNGGFQVANLVLNYLRSQEDYGAFFQDQELLVALVDQIYAETGDEVRDRAAKKLKEVIKSMNLDLVEGKKHGKVAINQKYFFALLRKIDHIFNNLIAQATVAQALAESRNSVLRSSAGAYVVDADPSLTLESLQAEQQAARQMVQYMYQRVQDYVQRTNAIAEAYEQFIKSSASMAFFVVTKFDYYGLDRAIQNTIQQGLEKGFDATLGNLAEAVGAGVNHEGVVEGQVFPKLELGEWEIWDGNINLHDLAGLATRILLSPNVVDRIALAIYEHSERTEKSNKKEAEGVEAADKDKKLPKAENAWDALDRLEYQTAQAEVRLGDATVSDQIRDKYKEKVKNFYMELIKSIPENYSISKQIRKRKEFEKERTEQINLGKRMAEELKAKKIAASSAVPATQLTEQLVEFAKDVIEKIVKEITASLPLGNPAAAQAAAAAAAGAMADTNPVKPKMESGKVAEITTSTSDPEAAEKSQTLDSPDVAQTKTRPKTDNLLRAATRVREGAEKASRASQSLDQEGTDQKLASLKSGLQQLATLISSNGNKKIGEKLREIRKNIRHEVKQRNTDPVKLQGILNDLNKATGDLKLQKVQEQIRIASHELEHTVQNCRDIKTVNERVEVIKEGLKDTNQPVEELTNQATQKKPGIPLIRSLTPKILERVAVAVNKSPVNPQVQARFVSCLGLVADSLPDGKTLKNTIKLIGDTLQKVKDSNEARELCQKLPEGVKGILSSFLSPAVNEKIAAMPAAPEVVDRLEKNGKKTMKKPRPSIERKPDKTTRTEGTQKTKAIKLNLEDKGLKAPKESPKQKEEHPQVTRRDSSDQNSSRQNQEREGKRKQPNQVAEVVEESNEKEHYEVAKVVKDLLKKHDQNVGVAV